MAEISPVLYTADRSGAGTLTAHSEPLVDAARSLGVSIIPAIQNHHDGGWDGAMIRAIIDDPGRRSQHVRHIVDVVANNDWDGIDIDYEQIPEAASSGFEAILRQLSIELHRRDKVLSVAVPAKTTDRGGDPTAAAYDYAGVGAVADEVRVMAYDHSWATWAPGPVAPARWVREVLDYARPLVPADKLMLGIAAYGYDWAGPGGSPISATAAAGLADGHESQVRWDEAAESAWFSHTSARTRHTVWFENAKSMLAKARLAAAAGIRGVAIWKLGGEDSAFWKHFLAIRMLGTWRHEGDVQARVAPNRYRRCRRRGGRMRGDRVEIVIDAGDGTKTYEIVATRAGRRVEITTGRGIVQVSEVRRSGAPVRTAQFMASRVVALVEHPAEQASSR